MLVFLFTDIEGSTSLWQKFPTHMGAVIARHDNLVTGLIEKHGGKVIKNTGDGLFAIFEQGEPLSCALEIEKGIARQDWGALDELRVRVALHIGEAVRRGEDYFGLDVNRTVRLLTAGWGGQILLTCELARAVSPPPGAVYRDQGIHTLKDLSEPQHIFELTHAELPMRDFPPLRTLSAHPHNLPPQPTPFVGRADELAAITRRLADPGCRLLTLAGPGGIGKTRLALQAAAGQVEVFRHGVFFVPLAPLDSGALLVPAIAEGLKFTFYRRDNPKDQLLNYLHEKNILLVLDNFEHLAPSSGLVSEILTAAPQVKVLATSRERLALREEEIFLVEGMRFPGEALTGPDQHEGLDEFSSVKLFLQSAHRVQPGYELPPEDRSCVARICRLVQGAPLGIELAAGWLRSLSCQEIADEIEASLDFLETSLRDVPDRHRSLRAVFDYSWALLSEAERQTLMRLSVFQGAFGRQSAEAVMEPASGARRPALLTALVDKSLLRRNTDGSYDLHSLMRHYALERLEAEAKTAARTRSLHAAHFIALLAADQTALIGRDQPKALRRVAAYLENARSAWLWTLAQGQWQMADDGLNGLYLFFNLRNREEETVRLLGEGRALLAHAAGPGAERLSLRVDIRYAVSCAVLNRFDEARPILENNLEAARRMKHPAEVALVYEGMGKIAWIEGDYARTVYYDREALEIYRQLQNPTGMAGCLDRLGTSAWSMGDYTSARQFMLESLELQRQDFAPTNLARVLDHLGVVARDSGDVEAAGAYFEESKQIIDGLDAPGQLAFVLNHLAGIKLAAGQVNEAVAQFEQSIDLSRQVGDQRALGYNLFDLAGVMFNYLADMERARRLYHESQTIFDSIGERFGSVLASNGSAGVAFAIGDKAAGLERLRQSLRVSLEIQNARLTAYTLLEFVNYLYQNKRTTEGIELLGFLLGDPNMDEHASQNSRTLLEALRPGLSLAEVEAALARGRSLGMAQVCAQLEQESG